MLFATVGQLPKLMLMAAAGAIVGCVYLLLRFVRGRICAGFWLGLICDLIFGAAAAVILCAGLVISDGGRVRAYQLAGAGAGFLATMAGFAPAMRAIVTRICAKLCGIRKKRWFLVLFR